MHKFQPFSHLQSSGLTRGPYTAQDSAPRNYSMDPASSAGTERERVCGGLNENLFKRLIVIPAYAGIWFHTRT